MKKCVIAINEFDFGSTGNVAKNVLSYLSKQGFETYLASSFPTIQNDPHSFQISINKISYLKSKILCRFAATDGFHAHTATNRFIRFLEAKKPDYLFINNLHGGYINIPILFNYIKKYNIKVIWTLHDCWTFTGKCAHFTYAKCNKWQSVCGNCPCLHEHPRAYFFDKSKQLFIKKKSLFEGMEKFITFVTPSKWLYDLVKKSYLKEFNVKVINNGVADNTDIETLDNLINKEWLKDKIVFFSAGMPLGEKKGMLLLNKLADDLDPNKYAIIVAGVDKKRISPNVKLIDVGCLKSRQQMNYFYNLADYYLNLTLEENYPTVLMESQFMGTPIISFDTGGCKETMINNDKNILVKYNDYKDLIDKIHKLNPKKLDSKAIDQYKDEHSINNMCIEYGRLFK